MGTQVENLKDFTSWEKMWLRTFTHPWQPTVRVVVQNNPYYGDLISAFQIGEERNDTSVPYKMEGLKGYCKFLEMDSLLGIRPFKKGSITYEFLWVPLDLPVEMVITRKHGNYTKEYWTSFYEFSQAIETIGYEEF
jgi:hypothetical protein